MGGNNKEKRKRSSTADRSGGSLNASMEHSELLNEIRNIKTDLTSIINSATETLEGKIESLKLDFDLKIANLSQSVDARILDAAASYNAKHDQLNRMVTDELDRLAVAIDAKVLQSVKKITADLIPAKKIESRLDRLERSELLSDVVVIGVPDAPALETIIPMICAKIGYTDNINSIVAAYRQPLRRIPNNIARTTTTAADVPIVIKFRDFDCKKTFFSLYLKSKITLKDIGFLTAKRIYINDKLTQKNNEIKVRAMEYKRAGKIFNYFIFRGLIFIRVNETDRSICMSNIDQFSSLLV